MKNLIPFLVLVFVLADVAVAQQAVDDLLALTIADENRCTDYDRSDYSYPGSRSFEESIRDAHGFGMYSPYDSTLFTALTESDIEHIVATSEAHDSGMCGRSAAAKRMFARDLDNLTLATPSLNRHQKSAKDACDWLPPKNRVWYVGQVAKVKRKYSLTVDQCEFDRMLAVLSGCDSVAPPAKQALATHHSQPLIQNYPNPFNPSTTIEYELAASEHVRLEVFDAMGRRVKVLADGTHPAGRHSVRFDGSGLPSGLYIYRMQANGEAITKTMTLVR